MDRTTFGGYMALKKSFRSLGIRPCRAIAPRRTFEHKFAMVEGHLSIVDPRPGCTYVRAERGQGHEHSWPPIGRGRGESLYSDRRIESRLKAFEAFQLWCDGLTWEQIAVRLGYANASVPWRAVRRLHDRIDYNKWLKAEEAKYS